MRIATSAPLFVLTDYFRNSRNWKHVCAALLHMAVEPLQCAILVWLEAH
jgi:hypothetical protein